MAILLKLVCKIKTEETVSKSFYEVAVTLILKPQKDSTKILTDQFPLWTYMKKYSIKYLQIKSKHISKSSSTMIKQSLT